MMDPISAVSLAGGILQFIDFAQKLFRKTVSLHRGNTNDERTDLALVTQNLSSLLLQLDARNQTAQASSHGNFIENGLSAVDSQCSVVGQELAAALHRLDVTSTQRGIRRLALSFYQALKITWSKEHIERLRQRLGALRDHAQFALIVALDSKAAEMREGQDQEYQILHGASEKLKGLAMQNASIFSQLDDMSALIVSNVMSERQAFEDAMEEISSSIDKGFAESTQSLRTIDDRLANLEQTLLPKISSDQSMEDGIDTSWSERVLEMFRFPAMNAREQNIREMIRINN